MRNEFTEKKFDAELSFFKFEFPRCLSERSVDPDSSGLERGGLVRLCRVAEIPALEVAWNDIK